MTEKHVYEYCSDCHSERVLVDIRTRIARCQECSHEWATEQQAAFKRGERVAVLALAVGGTLPGGTVTNIRHDDRGVPILTVTMDDPNATASGLYYAREWEVKPFDASLTT